MTNEKTKNTVLWVVQGLLAALFLFAGSSKWFLPAEVLKGSSSLPIAFLRFIGIAELLGGLGLVLPGLLRIRQGLTPLAACGLATIMIGATVVTIVGGAAAPALIPLAIGALAALVALGRRRPLGTTPRADVTTHPSLSV